MSVQTLRSACPLDCPDACSLEVQVENGRVVKIDGDHRNYYTQGYICSKVRRFPEHLYGDDRLLYPMRRAGTKGEGRFERISWDEALGLVSSRLLGIRERFGGEAILPYYYGGSNGLLTQETTDARYFRRLGASRLLRTVCAAPTGRAALGLYGKMAGVALTDYPHARLIVVWGVNPSNTGIHLVPHIQEAQRRGAKLVVVNPLRINLAKQADMHLAVRPGADLPLALAVHRWLFENGAADLEFLARHAHGADELRRRAAPWTLERAAEACGVPAAEIEAFARLYAESSPAVIRSGWGMERNRNGGSAVAAVLALPAVAGKFGVRGGGYTMSNSAVWKFASERAIAEPERSTREVNMNKLGDALCDYDSPPVKALFVYNNNPLATSPNQEKIRRGLGREDLFTVVFEQVRTDTVPYADVVLPATTFLEHYDFARGYGPVTLQLGKPVIDSVGESRSNTDVFMDLARRLDLTVDGDPADDLEAMLTVLAELPPQIGDDLRDNWVAKHPPQGGRPVQFVDVFPKTADKKVDLFPALLDKQAPMGLYGFQPDPGTADFPLALISPASDRTISSTLGELKRPDVKLEMNPADAEARGVEDGDTIRVWNNLGEVRIKAVITDLVRPGLVAMPKGVWRRHTANGYTSNALTPDSLTDLGGGACFNDARVQVEKLEVRS
jgi:anaerobic selenocysteine-containing dehydrogenase